MGEKCDSRVLTLGEQDAMMTDIDDRGRPPGDPPDTTKVDAAKVWVSKVVGSSGGGVPKPESVINRDFVKERMQVEFPDGDDGEPVITIGAEVLEAMNGLWKQCIIVKVLGRNIPISVFNKKLRELWKPTGGMNVMDLPNQFFMVRLEKEEEYLAALSRGPWRAFGSHLMVQVWTLEFNPLRDDIVTTPVWVRLSSSSQQSSSYASSELSPPPLSSFSLPSPSLPSLPSPPSFEDFSTVISPQAFILASQQLAVC